MARMSDALSRTRKLAVLFAATSVALGVAVAILAGKRPAAAPGPGELALLDDGVRQAAIAELVRRGSGLWDSHPDPDVARVLQPRLDGRELLGVPVSSNRFGMREREYGPKAPGTTRVVLLGDSFVFGHGTPANERVGSYLEPWLAERGSGPVEVLHLGISSWDIVAEAAFVRRQLSFLQPDLVVQMVFNNDLDDVTGVRGFGERARFAPRHRERADGIVSRDAPTLATGISAANLLLYGLDGESRDRYHVAATALTTLADAVEAVGARYVCVFMWLYFQPLVERHLTGGLEPEQIVYVPDAFLADRSLWAAPDNNHWNAAGSRRVATLLFGVIEERGLLPQLGLSTWPEARAELAAMDAAGRAEARDTGAVERRLAAHQVASRLDFTRLDARSVSQINGGVDGAGYAAPYASITLARDLGDELVVRGRRLDRPELSRGEVEVHVDEARVGTFALRGAPEIDARFALPDAILGRDLVAVKFVSPDYVYAGELLDRCVSFQLTEVRVE
jgi:lysophospholipase L1-like esterase